MYSREFVVVLTRTMKVKNKHISVDYSQKHNAYLRKFVPALSMILSG
jgi:hypothetical protein